MTRDQKTRVFKQKALVVVMGVILFLAGLFILLRHYTIYDTPLSREEMYFLAFIWLVSIALFAGLSYAVQLLEAGVLLLIKIKSALLSNNSGGKSNE